MTFINLNTYGYSKLKFCTDGKKKTICRVLRTANKEKADLVLRPSLQTLKVIELWSGGGISSGSKSDDRKSS